MPVSTGTPVVWSSGMAPTTLSGRDAVIAHACATTAVGAMQREPVGLAGPEQRRRVQQEGVAGRFAGLDLDRRVRADPRGEVADGFAVEARQAEGGVERDTGVAGLRSARVRRSVRVAAGRPPPSHPGGRLRSARGSCSGRRSWPVRATPGRSRAGSRGPWGCRTRSRGGTRRPGAAPRGSSSDATLVIPTMTWIRTLTARSPSWRTPCRQAPGLCRADADDSPCDALADIV